LDVDSAIWCVTCEQQQQQQQHPSIKQNKVNLLCVMEVRLCTNLCQSVHMHALQPAAVMQQ
jgi:hypothetical protein